MKNKRASIALAVLFITLLIWSLFLRQKGGPPTQSSAGITTNRTTKEITNQRPVENPKSPSAREGFSVGEIAKRLIQRHRDVDRANDEWRAPIDFFGKVVDEKGQPVPEASVEFSWNNLQGTTQRTARSGADGLFSLNGEQGKHLAVNVSKSGYYTSKSNLAGFFYAGRDDNFVPNRSQPVVFHLRKQGPAEMLHVSSGRIKVPLDGTQVMINLWTGQPVVTGGDLRVTCLSKRGELEQKYDWELSISVPNGGIQETGEEFPFLAPNSSYESVMEIAMHGNDPISWQNTIHRTYFVRLPEGRYGRLSLFFVAYNGVLRFDATINPSGSRNLEYSEAAQSEETTR